ncbi:DNA-processing protein DprA [Parashewanella curva]|nr:DNA-processing protein DprA [Parashewanella curva]
MNKVITENTKVILLLTTYFNASESKSFSPLSVNGYGYFARWLFRFGYQPLDLLDDGKLKGIFFKWGNQDTHIEVKQKVALSRLDKTISDITFERVNALIGRGASLSMALDKWSSAGIWILDRSHPDYPTKIKSELKDQAPAVLFGIGNPALLRQQSIGFVGSRKCEQADLDATETYVNIINNLGYQVVSGAAKGVDSHSMITSLENGHCCIGVVSDSLFKASATSQWRKHLKDERLVLISPFFPEAKFSPANAMQRNKYIYLLSQASVVVRSEDTGGTWEGATENLKKGWVPLIVSGHKQPNYIGNQEIINGLRKAQITAQEVNTATEDSEWLKLIKSTTHNVEEKKISSHTEAQTSFFDTEISTPVSKESTNQSLKLSYANKDELDFTDTYVSNSSDSEQSEITTTLEPTKDSNDQALYCLPIDTVDMPQGDVGSDLFEADNDKAQITIPNDSCEEGVIKYSESIDDEAKSLSDHQGVPNYLSMPLIDVFYKQVVHLIEEKNGDKKLVELDEIKDRFPDFQIISKTAIEKWVNHLVEQNKLTRPSRMKKFGLPEDLK